MAEQNLDQATSTKVRVEENSGTQIEALINDVNQARTAARKETETRIEIEKETQSQIDYMASELQDARKSLEAEGRSRIELDRVSEFARETSQRLDEAEAKVAQMMAEKETAEQQVLASSKALQEVSEEAARQMLQYQSKAKSSISTKDLNPVKSSLSMNHPVLQSMLERFIARLTHQLQLMESSIQHGQYLDLLVSVNWLKGDANSLGFSSFDTVIAELELNLRQQSFENIPALVEQLKDIASRIGRPEAGLVDGTLTGGKARRKIKPIQLVLPKNDKKAELQENFIAQLGSKLLEMETAWQEHNTSRLQKNCRWIHRYSLKMKLVEITGPTEKLKTALDEEDDAWISQHLQDFLNLYSNIVIVRK
jgi:HPt (histidine-containing phosphotransfer) domain-containing protein